MKSFFSFKGKVFKDALLLISGTSIVQLFPALMMPFLARLYSPEAFGAFGVYVGIVTLFSIISTGRYELAILLPKKERDANALFFVAIFMALAFCFLFMLSISAYDFFEDGFLSHDIAVWFALPILLMGFCQVLINFGMRYEKFRCITEYRILLGVGLPFFQIILAWIDIQYRGLILGHVLIYFFASIFLFRQLMRDENRPSLVFSYPRSWMNLVKYRRFLFFSTPGAFFDALALQIPLFLLAFTEGNETAGYFSFAFRLLNLPTALFAIAIGQLFFQKITKMSHTHAEKIPSYVFKLFLLLFAVILPFVVLMQTVGPSLFVFIFGETWAPSSLLLGPLSFAMGIRFMVSPLSGVLMMHHTVRLGFFWQCLYCLTLSVTLIVASSFGDAYFLSAYVIHELILYSIYFLLILKGARLTQAMASPSSVTALEEGI